MMVLFSIIIPVYNKEKYILATIRSVLSQSEPDFEIIVIDDGSHDRSVHQIQQHISDPRLRIYSQPNSGVSVARNKGISLSVGQYICFLDADDLWGNFHLSFIKQLIDFDPSALGWATGYFVFVDESEIRDTAGSALGDVKESHQINLLDYLSISATRPTFYTSSITIPSTLLKKLNPCFPEGERIGEDLDLWVRLLHLGSIRFYPVKQTVYYRSGHADNLTSTLLTQEIPFFFRLRQMTNHFPDDLRRAALRLCNVNRLQIAWSLSVLGHKQAAYRILLSTTSRDNRLYWFRVLVSLLFPSFFIRYPVRLAVFINRLLNNKFHFRF